MIYVNAGCKSTEEGRRRSPMQPRKVDTKEEKAITCLIQYLFAALNNNDDGGDVPPLPEP